MLTWHMVLQAPLRDELGVELGYVTGHTVVGGTDKRYSIVVRHTTSLLQIK